MKIRSGKGQTLSSRWIYSNVAYMLMLRGIGTAAGDDIQSGDVDELE